MGKTSILFVMGSINPERGGVARVGCNLSMGLLSFGYLSYSISETIDSEGYFIKSWKFQIPKISCEENKSQILELYNNYKFDYVIVENPHFSWMIDVVSVLKGKTCLIGEYHNSPFGAYSIIKQDSVFSFLLSYKWFRKIVFYYRAKKNKEHWNKVNEVLDHLVLLSESYYKELLTLAYFPKEKVSAIANPFPKIDIMLPIEKNNTMVFVGRIAGLQKGLRILLDVWKQVSAILPNWQLKIVGGGDELDYWKSVSKNMELKRIHFEGFQSSESYYKESKIFLMTSLYEGFPMTLVEAMQYGCVPVVFDSFSAVRDIVDDNINGIIVKSFKKKEYVNAVLNLAKNPGLLENLSYASKHKAQNFDVSEITNKWIALFTRLKRNENN